MLLIGSTVPKAMHRLLVPVFLFCRAERFETSLLEKLTGKIEHRRAVVCMLIGRDAHLA